MKLYHYTSFNTFIKIWHTKSLLFQPFYNVNDRLEHSKFVRIPDFSSQSADKLRELDEQLVQYRQISLVVDYNKRIKGFMSSMMWGHYGDRGNGVCIELESDKLNLSLSSIKKNIVRYCDDIKAPMLQKEDDIANFIDAHNNYLFFQKTKEWSGENENRLISNIQQKLDISKAITAVYMDEHYRPETQTVLKLVGEDILHIVVPNRMTNGDGVSYPIKAFKWKHIIK